MRLVLSILGTEVFAIGLDAGAEYYDDEEPDTGTAPAVGGFVESRRIGTHGCKPTRCRPSIGNHPND